MTTPTSAATTHPAAPADGPADFLARVARHLPGFIFQYVVQADGRTHLPYISGAVQALHGVSPDEVAADADALLRHVLPEHRAEVAASMQRAVATLAPWTCEYRVAVPGRPVRWLLANALPHREADGSTQVHGFTMDVTERKESQAQIERLAFYDVLTGLPNRRLFLDRLQQALARSERSALPGAVLFIDLDNFKDLNDTVGHDSGDRLLRLVGERLANAVRASDTVSRFGGDEFVVMLEALEPRELFAITQVEAIAGKLVTELNQPFELDGQPQFCTPSIGVALFRGDAVGPDELLKHADLAMYQAKAAGRNTLRFFDPEMQTAVSARSALEADLRRALRNNELLLYFQPVVTGSGRMTGAEALLRWRHPERGLVPPMHFIPLAERTGLILPMGQWVLQAACAQLVEWARAPATEALTLAVNVSVRQFRHPDFVPQLQDLLQRTGAPPQRLKLELTESMLLQDVEETVTKLETLKALGVSFSLDDFGTGYSSLAYLKRLPLDQLKIDRSFVQDVLSDPNDAAIVRTILGLARTLNLDVVAEGVETEGQRDFLIASGCRGFQGYLFGKPVPVGELLPKA